MNNKKINWIIPTNLKDLKDQGLTANSEKIIKQHKIQENKDTLFLEINKNNFQKTFKELTTLNEKMYLLKSLEKLYDFADSLTKSKITKLFSFHSKYTYHEIKKQVEEIENRVNYGLFHQSGAMNELNYNLYFKKEVNNLCILDPFTKKNATLKTKEDNTKNGSYLEYRLENFKYYKDVFSITTSKLFIYSVSKIDFTTNTSKFTFTEYAKDTNVTSHSKNRLQLKNDLEILKKISNLKYENTKKDRLILNTLIIKADYNKGNIEIEFNKEFAANLKNTYMYFPKKLLKLKGKDNTKVFILGWYLFTQMRTNFKTEITISIKSCLRVLDFPNIEDIKKNHNRRYLELLIEPFNNIIDTLSEEVPELYIEFDRDYNNINEFMKSQIEIKLKNNIITDKYKNQNEIKKKKNIKHNIDKKLRNISLAKEYKEKGLNIKEISVKLKLSERTVKRYFGQK